MEVRDIEVVGEHGCESCGCAVVAGWAMVGGYVALAVGGVAAWESTAVDAAGCHVRSWYFHQHDASE